MIKMMTLIASFILAPTTLLASHPTSTAMFDVHLECNAEISVYVIKNKVKHTGSFVQDFTVQNKKGDSIMTYIDSTMWSDGWTYKAEKDINPNSDETVLREPLHRGDSFYVSYDFDGATDHLETSMNLETLDGWEIFGSKDFVLKDGKFENQITIRKGEDDYQAKTMKITCENKLK